MFKVLSLALAWISWSVVLIAVIIMTGAYRRFLNGKFKEMLGWILLAFWFMAVPYTSFVLRDTGLLIDYEHEISLFIYFCMTITSICLILGAIKLANYSKVFGFADVKAKFEKKVEREGKQTGQKENKTKANKPKR